MSATAFCGEFMSIYLKLSKLNGVVFFLSGTPSMTGTATIAVSIVDANDNAPVIKYLPNYPLVVRAEAKQGHKVFCFTAEEQDMSLNPSFTFTYICSSAAACNDFVLQQTRQCFL